jgi:hypothetical protein
LVEQLCADILALELIDVMMDEGDQLGGLSFVVGVGAGCVDDEELAIGLI